MLAWYKITSTIFNDTGVRLYEGIQKKNHKSYLQQKRIKYNVWIPYKEDIIFTKIILIFLSWDFEGN